MASAQPGERPAAPMSSSARRVGMTERIRMTAPIVPNGDRRGSGRKYGQRRVDLVDARRDVVPELVRQQDGEQRRRELRRVRRRVRERVVRSDAAT